MVQLRDAVGDNEEAPAIEFVGALCVFIMGLIEQMGRMGLVVSIAGH